MCAIKIRIHINYGSTPNSYIITTISIPISYHGGVHKQLAALTKHLAGIAEHFDLGGQAVGYAHLPAVAPELRVPPFGHLVVQDDDELRVG